MFSVRATDCTSVLAQENLGFEENGGFNVYKGEGRRLAQSSAAVTEAVAP
jgi:hypothetical protein